MLNYKRKRIIKLKKIKKLRKITKKLILKMATKLILKMTVRLDIKRIKQSKVNRKAKNRLKMEKDKERIGQQGNKVRLQSVMKKLNQQRRRRMCIKFLN